MNSAAVTEGEEIIPAIEGPGVRLKAIRESKGLDLSSVAAALHLSESKLTALESDDYDALSGSVFAQGYLRNYARLLEIPVDQVLDAYRQLQPEAERALDLKVGQSRQEVRSNHGVVRLITWLIVLGLIGLMLTWWQGYIQWPMVSENETTDQISIEEADEKPYGDLGVPLETDVPTFDSGQSSMSLPVLPAQESLTEPQNPDPTTSAADNGSDGTREVPPVALQDAAGQEVVATPIPAETSSPVLQSATAETMQETTITSGITLEFTDDCWVRINDASGRFNLSGTQRKGSQRTLGGTAPYEMVLGNAQAVILKVDGELFDLAPYISGNVAKFRLEPN